MHRHRIVAQISLILSILNLVLAAPMEVQGIHETPSEDSEVTVVAENAAATDVVDSPQHSYLSDGSISSGHLSPHLSSASSASGYSWMLERPPRLSLNIPASLDGSASHPLSPGSSGSPLPAPEHPVSFPFPEWLEQVLPSQLEGEEQYSLEAMPTLYSPASDGSLSPQYHTASEEPPHHLTPDAPPPPLPQASQPSTGTLSDNSEFFNENMTKKLKIVAGVVIIGSVIASIVGSQIKHRGRDYEDS